jgi:hypothetical protein
MAMHKSCTEIIKVKNLEGKVVQEKECLTAMRPIDVDEEKMEVIWYCDACEASEVVKVDRIEFAWQHCPSCLEEEQRGKLMILAVGQLVQGYDHEQNYRTQCLNCGNEWLIEAILRPVSTFRGREYASNAIKEIA